MRKIAVLTATSMWLWGCSATTDANPSADLDFQDEILTDDLVTESEMEAAVIAFLTCVEDAGYSATGPLWNRDPHIPVFEVRIPTADTQQGEATMDQCEKLFLDRVNFKWQQQIQPSPAQYQEEFDLYKQCLTDAGIAGVETIEDAGALAQFLQDSNAEIPEECLSLDPNRMVINPGGELPEFNGPGAS